MTRTLLFCAFLFTGFMGTAQVANQPEDLLICEENSDGIGFFDLTITAPEILGSQNPSDFTITYYISLIDAQNAVNPVASPEIYVNTSNPQTIYVRLESLINGMFDTTDFNILVEDLPPDLGPFEMFLCDDTLNGSTPDDEISTFDLTSQNDVVTGGDSTLTVTWYETQADEIVDNPIAVPTAYQNISTPQSVIGRVSSLLDCRTIVTLTLTVLPNPSPNMNPTPLVTCDIDADGFSEFDLLSKDVEIIDGEPDVNVLYFETLINAEMGNPIDALVSPYNNIVPFSQTVYARVTRDVPPAIVPCYTIVELELQAAPVPDEPDSSFINPLVVSDTDGDGIEAFDLTINDAAVIGIQSPSDFEPITHHTTLIDAEFDQNPILNADNFISSGQTIWVRLENLITGCYRITPFDIVVEGIILAQQPVDVFINEGDDNGQAIFDLTTQEAAMLGSLDPLVHQFTYHVSLSDSNNNENAIANPMAYQNIANPQTIYIRLTNTDNGFYALTNFQIETDGILGVESVLENLIALYPNPVSNEIHIQSSEALSNLEIRVYDMNGRLLVFETERGTIDHHRLDVSQFSNGMFWIEITSNGQRLVKPFVKE